MVDGRRDGLAGLGAEAHDLEARRVDLLRELVHGDVRRRRHEDLPHALLRQVPDDRRGRHGLARARRPLDQRQRLRHDGAHGRGLGVVQVRQAGNARAAAARRRRAALQHLGLDVVAQEPVVEVAAQRRVVDGQILQRVLHAVVGRALPHEIDDEAALRDLRGGIGRPQLQRDLAVGEAQDVARRLPGLAVLARAAGVEADLELVADGQTELVGLVGRVGVAPRQRKDGDVALREAPVPAHGHVLARLGLADASVVVRLELDERREHVLVVVAVLVRQQDGLRVVLGQRARRVEVPKVRVGRARPEFLDRADPRRRRRARAPLRVLLGLPHEPRQEPPVGDQRQPFVEVPVHGL
mmetsp:Transcript_35599/g.120617  ORF Transcript_35599/g.120617 Transcript_35599/m.120617 type:complete len:354 (+) Transcript_35599:1382-2443(+)